jgi:hypothetical protein
VQQGVDIFFTVSATKTDTKNPIAIFQPFSRRFELKGGTPLSKQLLNMFLPFAIISLKSDLNAIVMRYFLRHYSIVDEK